MSQQGSRFNQAVAGNRTETPSKTTTPAPTSEQQALGMALLLETSQNSPDSGKIADLIARGAALDMRNARESTPLILAARGGHEYIADMLIHAGANVNARDNEGSTPLILAAIAGSVKTVRNLTDNNADANVIGKDHDRTALMWAAALGRREIAQLLIRRGADAEQQNSAGQTAYDIARMHENYSLAEVLKAGAQQHKDAGNARPAVQTARGTSYKDMLGKV